LPDPNKSWAQTGVKPILPMSQFDPGKSTQIGVPVLLKINLDGRALAAAQGEFFQRMGMFPSQAPNFDSNASSIFP
jgi:hypothetical protein